VLPHAVHLLHGDRLLIFHESFHLLEHLDFLISIMKQHHVWQIGLGLTQPHKDSYLIGVAIYPKWLICYTPCCLEVLAPGAQNILVWKASSRVSMAFVTEMCTSIDEG
jgi:hypothetical protein